MFRTLPNNKIRMNKTFRSGFIINFYFFNSPFISTPCHDDFLPDATSSGDIKVCCLRLFVSYFSFRDILLKTLSKITVSRTAEKMAYYNYLLASLKKNNNISEEIMIENLFETKEIIICVKRLGICNINDELICKRNKYIKIELKKKIKT